MFNFAALQYFFLISSWKILNLRDFFFIKVNTYCIKRFDAFCTKLSCSSLTRTRQKVGVNVLVSHRVIGLWYDTIFWLWAGFNPAEMCQICFNKLLNAKLFYTRYMGNVIYFSSLTSGKTYRDASHLELHFFRQGSKRQWPINWCSSSILIYKIKN